MGEEVTRSDPQVDSMRFDKRQEMIAPAEESTVKDMMFNSSRLIWWIGEERAVAKREVMEGCSQLPHIFRQDISTRIGRPEN
jgi:hypothetical protein